MQMDFSNGKSYLQNQIQRKKLACVCRIVTNNSYQWKSPLGVPTHAIGMHSDFDKINCSYSLQNMQPAGPKRNLTYRCWELGPYKLSINLS